MNAELGAIFLAGMSFGAGLAWAVAAVWGSYHSVVRALDEI